MALEVAGGQWAVKYNNQTLEGIEEVEVEVDREEAEVPDISGFTYRKTTNRTAEVVLTVYSTGIANLKKILPDFWQDQGTAIAGQPTGVVAKASGGTPAVTQVGVITFGTPKCGDTAQLSAPLQLIPCENPNQHTVTLFDGTAEITDLTIDDSILKIEVTVRSNAVGVQLAKGAITFPA